MKISNITKFAAAAALATALMSMPSFAGQQGGCGTMTKSLGGGNCGGGLPHLPKLPKLPHLPYIHLPHFELPHLPGWGGGCNGGTTKGSCGGGGGPPPV